MRKELDDLLNGLRWLGEQGREAAQEVWAVRNAISASSLGEAIGWLEDIAEGKDPS